MLKALLQNHIDYPMLGYILNYGVYYPLIFLGIVVGISGAYRRLVNRGYERSRVRVFMLLALLVTYPAAIVGGRAANMFYYPHHYWSLSFFWEQLVSGRFVTFHAGLLLPVVLLALLTRIMKLRFVETMDTLFLYIPLGHAIGRVGCLMVGCCWGDRLSFTVFGSSFAFDNPVPLYAIMINLAIFFVLRAAYEATHGSGGRHELGGTVIALYLILYGNFRVLMEVIRNEMIVFAGLTQAQVVMIVFIGCGALMVGGIVMIDRMRRISPSGEEFARRRRLVLSVLSFTVFFVVLTMASYTLLVKQVVNWPFHRVRSVTAAYHSILEYLPVLVVSLATVAWLRANRMDILAPFRWGRFTWLFPLGIAGSVGYVIYILVPLRFGVHNAAIWPPVIILSVLNAAGEEVMFRLVLFRMLRGITARPWTAVVVQGAFYASFHFFIGGPVFGLLAFVYGTVLALMMERGESILPPLICHFLIDLGAIGAPILSS